MSIKTLGGQRVVGYVPAPGSNEVTRLLRLRVVAGDNFINFVLLSINLMFEGHSNNT